MFITGRTKSARIYYRTVCIGLVDKTIARLLKTSSDRLSLSGVSLGPANPSWQCIRRQVAIIVVSNCASNTLSSPMIHIA
jgi:hypothetical protein